MKKKHRTSHEKYEQRVRDRRIGEMIRQLTRENNAFGPSLQHMPEAKWPSKRPPNLFAVMRSADFLVQLFQEADQIVRITVNRTMINSAGGWLEGITWDDLQQIKSECGYGHRDAVEVYPAEPDVVNVSNMRHIWVLPEPVPFKWTRND